MQPQNISTLCKAVVETAQKVCPRLLDESEKISRVFGQALSLFSVCHNVYDSSRYLSDSEINSLSEYVYSDSIITYSFDNHNLISYRYQHSEVYGILPKPLPGSHCAPEDAHVRRSCCAIPSGMAHRSWIFGGAGSRIHTCSNKQNYSFIPEHGQQG